MSNVVDDRTRTFPGLKSGFAPSVTDAVIGLQNWLNISVLDDETKGHMASSASVVWVTTQASAFDLQGFAWRRLAEVRSRGDARPTPEALVSLDQVIRTYVADNGPTPQVGATPSGSIEVQWLAGGNLVSALFDETGDYNVYAQDANEDVLLDDDVAGGDMPTELRTRLASVLLHMGSKVAKRVPSWGTHV